MEPRLTVTSQLGPTLFSGTSPYGYLTIRANLVQWNLALRSPHHYGQPCSVDPRLTVTSPLRPTLLSGTSPYGHLTIMANLAQWNLALRSPHHYGQPCSVEPRLTVTSQLRPTLLGPNLYHICSAKNPPLYPYVSYTLRTNGALKDL